MGVYGGLIGTVWNPAGSVSAANVNEVTWFALGIVSRNGVAAAGCAASANPTPTFAPCTPGQSAPTGTTTATTRSKAASLR